MDSTGKMSREDIIKTFQATPEKLSGSTDSSASGVMNGKMVSGEEGKSSKTEDDKAAAPDKALSIRKLTALDSKKSTWGDKAAKFLEGTAGAGLRPLGGVGDTASKMDPTLVSVDALAGAFSHSVSLGLEGYKYSKLKRRKEAFEQCGDIASKWQGAASLDKQARPEDLRDYAVIAMLDDNNDPDNHLRNILAESKCRFGNDTQISQLATHLIALAGDQPGSKSSVLTKAQRGQPIANQLEAWKSDFDQKSEEFVARFKKNRKRSEDGKKLVKRGRESKKLMQQFNAIVKPMGLKMNYKTPLLRKFGESALASQHEFVVNTKRFHSHLKAVDKLPTKGEVQQQILKHEDDAEVLKLFANYEERKVDLHKNKVQFTTAALLTTAVPVAKVDYLVRAMREGFDGGYRQMNLSLMKDKKAVLEKMSAKYRAYAEYSTEHPMNKLLEDIHKTLDAKMERTDIKKTNDILQGGLDSMGFVAGSLAGAMAPGIGGMISDITLGVAKTTVASGGISARNQLDKETQQFGRIETNVYKALKKAYNEPSPLIDKEDIMTLTKSLFDISEEQVSALFKRSDEHDLVSAKEIIRLRFTNLSFDALKKREQLREQLKEELEEEYKEPFQYDNLSR